MRGNDLALVPVLMHSPHLELEMIHQRENLYLQGRYSDIVSLPHMQGIQAAGLGKMAYRSVSARHAWTEKHLTGRKKNLGFSRAGLFPSPNCRSQISNFSSLGCGGGR